MITVRTPLRVSMFGGSTDYPSFYQEYGSFLIGSTIDKYAYLSIRIRPKILSRESLLTYSRMDIVKNFDKITNPLLREIFRYRNVKDYIDFNSFSDVPFRTGLGGSSSYCVGMLYLIDQLYGVYTSKKDLVRDAVKIEREILNEPGGIQDHIWPVYGGLKTIEIHTNGDFSVKPIPITSDFIDEFENHLLLIYTNVQRNCEEIAGSHDMKNKRLLMDISRHAYDFLIKEDIKSVGKLLYESWLEKRSLSNFISSPKIDDIVSLVMSRGAYGAKLLGSGGCGFVLCFCDPKVKKILFQELENNILDVKFEFNGVSQIYPV